MDVHEAIQNRRSVRSYSRKPIPDDVLERMRQALRHAPSACNFQPWHFIFVTDAELRQKVAKASNDQTWMADAPVIVAACGLPDQAYKQMGGRHNSTSIDVAIAMDHLTLAAVAEGLGTCWIGAFNEEKVKELLGVPRQAQIIAMTPLGYPASPGMNAPVTDDQRKPAADIFSTNRYGQR